MDKINITFSNDAASTDISQLPNNPEILYRVFMNSGIIVERTEKISKKFILNISVENNYPIFKRVYELLEIVPPEFSHPSSNNEVAVYHNNQGREDLITKLKLIGVGGQGIIFFDGEEAWKFSNNIDHEASMLSKLRGANYVIQLKGSVRDSIALPISYIKGSTLENKICNRELQPSEIIQRSSEILKGLIEMRDAGIWYHCDIRPSNIMIDDENDKSIIIDLGSSTTDLNAPSVCNRRYGSYVRANDLVSLGQVIYKMTTGNHIFANDPSMEYSVYADNLKHYRDNVYAQSDMVLLSEHLAQVDRTTNTDIGSVIKACLTAEPNDHYKILEMF